MHCVEGFQSLIEFVQVEHHKTIIARLETLYGKAAELGTRLVSCEKLCLTIDIV